MEVMRIRLEDTYPDENNPRQAFDGIDELAESFKLNAARPGEPFVPPIVVRDGGIFRIVDGERRWRAMRKLGVAEFEANVCEDFDEADALVAMLATDDKAQLTELEKSRGVQRMLLLGVDPEKVERAARIEQGGSRKVRRAMQLVDDAAEDMTLDRMYAIAEFEGDDGAVEEIAAAPEASWALVAARIRRRKESERAAAALAAKATELGIDPAVPDKEIAGDRAWAYSWKHNARNPDELAAIVAEHPDARFGASPDGEVWYCYLPRADEGEEPVEDAEARKRAAELSAAFESAFADLRAWFDATAAPGGPLSAAHVRDLARDAFATMIGSDDLADRFPRLVGGGYMMSGADLAAGYEEAFQWDGLSPDACADVLALRDSWRTSALPEMADLFASAEEDGFAFEGEALAAKEAVEAFMEPEGGDE